MKEKAFPYLVLALTPFLFLALELVVLAIESLFYGTMNFSIIAEQRGVSAFLIHWGCTCVLWGSGVFLLFYLAKRRGFDVFEKRSSIPKLNWLIVALLLMLSAILSYFLWNMQFKPVAEFLGMTERFGSQGIIAFIAQYIYYAFEGGLFLAIIVFGQKFSELVFSNHKIPWGGILCGLTWGLGHIFTQDMLTGIISAAGAVFFGLAYLLLKKDIRFAYPIITLIFIV